MRDIPGVVVIGGYINALGLVRSLAARGVRAAVICTEPFDVAHRSNAVVGWDRAPQLDAHPERLEEVLSRRKREWGGWALLPSNDDALLAIEHSRAALEARHPLCAPDAGIIPRALDKAFMREIATRAGLTLPAQYGDATLDNPALAHAQFPVVVKPRRSQPFGHVFGCKLFIVPDRAALDTAIARVAQAGIDCTIDQWIDGGDDQIVTGAVYLGRDGSVAPAVFFRKIRQGPPFAGVARVAEIPTADVLPLREADALREQIVTILRPLGFHGVAEAEFKRDARTGAWHFIEVNIRSVLANSLLRKGGFDTAALCLGELATGRVPEVRPIAWPGVWVNIHADLLYAIAWRRRDPMTLRRFLAPYRRPMLEAVWSPRDPRPLVAQWAHTARRGLRALTGSSLHL